eukprot:6183129-Karenia_brevis.AAC.1
MGELCDIGDCCSIAAAVLPSGASGVASGCEAEFICGVGGVEAGVIVGENCGVVVAGCDGSSNG